MRLTISRIFDVTKAVATEAGAQLKDPLRYLSDLSEQVISALNNKLTFAENFDAQERVITLSDGVETLVTAPKQVKGMFVTRVVSASVGIKELTWFYDGEGLKVKVGFTASAEDVDVQLVFLF